MYFEDIPSSRAKKKKRKILSLDPIARFENIQFRKDPISLDCESLEYVQILRCNDRTSLKVSSKNHHREPISLQRILEANSLSLVAINPQRVERKRRSYLHGLFLCNLQSMVFFPGQEVPLMHTHTHTYTYTRRRIQRAEGVVLACSSGSTSLILRVLCAGNVRSAGLLASSRQFARINAAFVLWWPAECTVEMGLFRVRVCTHTAGFYVCTYVCVPLQSTK